MSLNPYIELKRQLKCSNLNNQKTSFYLYIFNKKEIILTKFYEKCQNDRIGRKKDYIFVEFTKFLKLD